MTGAATPSTAAELLAAVPTTGDEAVDRAMDQLRALLTAPAGDPESTDPDGGRRGSDAQVLAAVHDALQRRLSATAG